MPKVVISDKKGLVQSSGVGLDHKYAPTRWVHVADAADDTTITKLKSGDHVMFGTADGKLGSADADNAFTFQLPVPTGPGERIRVQCLTATAYNKVLGISSAAPATVLIRYIAREGGGFIESGVTALGTDGTETTMVKLNGTHFQIGDVYECTSLSGTEWLVEIDGAGGLIASGDIAPAAGNVAGYIS